MSSIVICRRRRTVPPGGGGNHHRHRSSRSSVEGVLPVVALVAAVPVIAAPREVEREPLIPYGSLCSLFVNNH